MTRVQLALILAVSETIRESGAVPSGHLYAGLLTAAAEPDGRSVSIQ